MEKLKIGIVDDDEEILDYYKNSINASKHMECVVCTTSAENFFKYISSYKDLDILLLDINLPGISGLNAISKIKFKIPKIHVVMMTTFSDDDSIFNALRSGATGYLLKTETPIELENMLLLIKDGGVPISPAIAKKIVEYFNPPKKLFNFTKRKNKLTKTEKIVLNILIKGLSYQEIADEMGTSINSVRTHIKSIYKKLEMNSRVKIIEKYRNFDFDQL